MKTIQNNRYYAFSLHKTKYFCHRKPRGLCYSIQWPVATRSCEAVEMWLVRIEKCSRYRIHIGYQRLITKNVKDRINNLYFEYILKWQSLGYHWLDKIYYYNTSKYSHLSVSVGDWFQNPWRYQNLVMLKSLSVNGPGQPPFIFVGSASSSTSADSTNQRWKSVSAVGWIHRRGTCGYGRCIVYY